ncbi:hypothetical protein ACW9YQ_27875 (plasmid) [Paraburkholderia strydomiana]
MFNKSLVTSEKSQRMLQMLGTDAGRKAYLGDTDAMETGAKVYALNAHIATRDAVAKVVALVDDKTRTEPQKHDAARKVANQTIDVLTKVQTQLKERGDMLLNGAGRDIDSFFANSTASDPGIRSDIRNWIKETMKTETGVATVRAAAEKDVRVAAELYESPTFLTGVTDNFRLDVTTQAVIKLYPDAAKQLEDGAALKDVAASYDKIIQEIPVHFYNPVIAEQATTRVEV